MTQKLKIEYIHHIINHLKRFLMFKFCYIVHGKFCYIHGKCENLMRFNRSGITVFQFKKIKKSCNNQTNCNFYLSEFRHFPTFFTVGAKSRTSYNAETSDFVYKTTNTANMKLVSEK